MTDLTPEMLAATQSFDDVNILWRDGRLSAKIVFKTVLFFPGGGTLDGQLAAVDTLAALAADVAPHLTHMQTAGTNARVEAFDLQGFTDRSKAGIEESFRTRRRAEDTDLDMALFGAPFVSPRNAGISPFGGSVAASAPFVEGDADLSLLEFSTTLMWDAPGGFRRQIDRTIRAAQMLGACHGLAGFGIQFDRINRSTTDAVAAYPMTRRFPGLHCSLDAGFRTAAAMGRSTPDRLFSVNWLTVVGNDMVGQLGGVAALTAALGPACPVRAYDGGVVITAGEHPQLGDVNQGLSLVDYRRVTAALSPVRFEDYKVGVFSVEKPLDPLEETLRWVKRFD